MKKVVFVIQLIVIVILPIVYCNIYLPIGSYFQAQQEESLGEYCDFRLLSLLMGIISALFLIVLLIVSHFFINGSTPRRIAVVLILIGHLFLGYFFLLGPFRYFLSGQVIQTIIAAVFLVLLAGWFKKSAKIKI